MVNYKPVSRHYPQRSVNKKCNLTRSKYLELLCHNCNKYLSVSTNSFKLQLKFTIPLITRNNFQTPLEDVIENPAVPNGEE